MTNAEAIEHAKRWLCQILGADWTVYDLCRLESGSYRSVDILTEHGRITVREGTDDPGHTFSIQVLAHEVLLEQRAGAVQRRLF